MDEDDATFTKGEDTSAQGSVQPRQDAIFIVGFFNNHLWTYLNFLSSINGLNFSKLIHSFVFVWSTGVSLEILFSCCPNCFKVYFLLRWTTRVFAAVCLKKIIADCCEGDRAHFDLSLAREVRYLKF